MEAKKDFYASINWYELVYKIQYLNSVVKVHKYEVILCKDSMEFNKDPKKLYFCTKFSKEIKSSGT